MATPIMIGSVGGEYMEAVMVVEWTAKLGEPVKKDDVIVVVETAKALSEIVAPCDGFLTGIFFDEGAEAPVSEVLGLIGATLDDHIVRDTASDAPLTPSDLASTPLPTAEGEQHTARHVGRVIASPLARAEAARRGIDLADVPVTSASGRIKRRDVIDMMCKGSTAASSVQRPTAGLNVITQGGGRSTVLMIHGFGADAMSWYPVSKPLAASCQVIALDLPNHGHSPQQETATFDALVDAVVHTVDKIDSERLHVVGHSLGGACAVALATQRPERILSLTLLAPAGCGAGVNMEFVHGLAKADGPDALEAMLDMLVVDRSLITREFLGAVLAARATPGLIEAQRKMAADLFPVHARSPVDVADRMSELTCQLQILWGLADGIIPLHEANQLPANANVSVLPRVGHVPQLEAPQRVLEQLLALIANTERCL